MGVAEVLKRKKPRTRTVEIVMNDELARRRDELIASISQQKRVESWADSGDLSSPLPALQDELRTVLDDLENDVVTFTFRPISRNDWNAAVDKYKNDDGELGDDFEIYIVAASSTGENALSEDQVRGLYDSEDWSAAETDVLWQAAYAVNREARDIPFTSAGIEAILSTGSNLTTAENEE